MSQKQGQPRQGKQAATGDVLEKHLARENGLLEAAVDAREGGSLKTGLWIGRMENTESLDYAIRSLNRLHGYSFDRTTAQPGS